MKFKDALLSGLLAYMVTSSDIWVITKVLQPVILWTAFTITFWYLLIIAEGIGRCIKKWIKRKRAQRAATLDGRTRKFITVKL